MTRLLLSVGLVFVTGLGWWTVSNVVRCPEECAVRGKRLSAAHTEYWTDNVCVSHDAHGSCEVSVPIEHSTFVPDRFYLGLTDVRGEAHEAQVDAYTFQDPPARLRHEHLRWRACPGGR